MANTYLTKTNSGAGSETKGTFSAWVKISELGDDNTIFHEFQSSGEFFSIKLKGGDFQVIAQANSSAFINVRTNAIYRDVSGWYNFVVAIDSTQGTEADRVKMYVNGVQETSFSTATYPSPSANCRINANNEQQTIGGAVNSEYFNGLMSHIHWVDGTAYDASAFGSTDSTTGEWKINTSPSVTYGTNGFFILKNGNSLTDESTNSNNFALGGGTLTNTEDCPSNVFATLNPLTYQVASQMSAPPTNGNTTLVSGSGGAWGTLISNIGATTGKYYFEAKCIANGSNCIVGAVDINDYRSNGSAEWYIGQSSTGQGYQNNGAASNGGASYGATYTNGDIIGVAMDLTNSKLYFSKNGTFQNSGDPTSGATGTGAMSLTAGTTYAFALTGYTSTTWYSNFGNGYFSTGAVASAGTNASGNGIFEYDTPTGYTALSTKGLNL